MRRGTQMTAVRATTKENNGRAADAAEPREETNRGQPRADRIRPPGNGSSTADRDLQSVRT